jgi:hypothetical protein
MLPDHTTPMHAWLQTHMHERVRAIQRQTARVSPFLTKHSCVAVRLNALKEGDYFYNLFFNKRPNGSEWVESLGDKSQVVDEWCVPSILATWMDSV